MGNSLESNPNGPAYSNNTNNRRVAKWYWKEDNMWHLYDDQTTKMLEDAFSNRQTSLLLEHGFFTNSPTGHTIDFTNYTQTNNYTHKSRAIKREGTAPRPDTLQVATLADSRMVKIDPAQLEKLLSKEYPDRPGPERGTISLSYAHPSAKINMVKKLTQWKDSEAVEHDCPICLCGLDEDVVVLSQCPGHPFHVDCIVHCLKENSQFLKCPCCGHIYGTGVMPKGTMSVHRNNTRLEGYYLCGTITITYSFPNGVQGPEHPNPGQSYSGTSRTTYLPDNKEGNEVLRLLQIAWERRLTFTIGTSVTSGATNAVVWNGIHHKTSMSGGQMNYGYPDDTYLERVTQELKDLGVL